MSRGSKKHNEEEEHEQYYKRLSEEEKAHVGAMLEGTNEMKKDAKLFSEMLDQDGHRIDHINNRLDGMTNKAQRNLSKMQRYLERTSNCKLYIILAVELFIFIVLMSL